MKKTLIAITALIALSTAVAAGSSPESLEKNKAVQKACKADYKKLCKKVKVGNGRIIKCLQENSAQLTPACKTALNQ